MERRDSLKDLNLTTNNNKKNKTLKKPATTITKRPGFLENRGEGVDSIR